MIDFVSLMDISRLALSAEIDVPPGHLALLCFDLFLSFLRYCSPPLFSVWFSSGFDANFIPFLFACACKNMFLRQSGLDWSRFFFLYLSRRTV